MKKFIPAIAASVCLAAVIPQMSYADTASTTSAVQSAVSGNSTNESSTGNLRDTLKQQASDRIHNSKAGQKLQSLKEQHENTQTEQAASDTSGNDWKTQASDRFNNSKAGQKLQSLKEQRENAQTSQSGSEGSDWKNKVSERTDELKGKATDKIMNSKAGKKVTNYAEERAKEQAKDSAKDALKSKAQSVIGQ